jgi:hypothetical protein
LHPFADVFPFILAPRRGADFREIGLIDKNSGKGIGIEFQVPIAAAFGSDDDVGNDGLCRIVDKRQARLRVEGADFGDHLCKVFVIDTANAFEGRCLPAPKTVEIVHQYFHGRIEPVAIG